MNLISENSSILITIIITTVSLILYFSYSFKRLKTFEDKKLEAIFLEIEVEKNNHLYLKKVPKEITKLESKTKATFKKINVNIFNIDYSYKEVLSNI
ncbi:hypothetical protein H9W90_10730 [Polaribacter pectinis]|uniref:Uncharacterized protein n=1 Tax=Polaribacter pectinis TaxID=2738844 RepID=A0A7G9L7S2_9FLAO|nr:hypothetical protein [Polaribacter pectinis]QNM84671.1 hypothetical protein H9W90_10730 [Polaribacter pectinis]